MYRIHKKNIYRAIAGILISAVALLFYTPEPCANIKTETFIRLEKIRKQKKRKVLKYFDNIKKAAYGIKNDTTMLYYFNRLKDKNYKEDSDLEYEIDKYAVLRYGNFYDILFIDSTGYVFHSLRKEPDYHTNIFKGELSSSTLAKRIKSDPGESSVEYEFYTPSDEPAAFFVVSLFQGGSHLGWFVLQCPINMVNSILTDYNGLGRTGEVYLVNKDKLMLSDSRFLDHSTILKQKVSTLAVEEAVTNNTGERIIWDYRDIRVFSSFEKFDCFGTTWIIIAEIDEDEIITEYYKKHKKNFQKKVVDYLNSANRTRYPVKIYFNKTKRVDMGEFARALPGTQLKTSGVSYCTAVAILYPEKFSYLAHISPTDKIYFTESLADIYLKKIKTDFLGKLIKKVKHYDIYPYELNKLHFVIIAPHAKSFPQVVDALLESGIELANIKFMYNPQARCANVIVDSSKDKVEVEWVSNKLAFLEYAKDIEDLGKIVKKMTGR